MSATGRSDVRRANDFYETPGWVTRALLAKLGPVSSVLDPCAGNGAILAEFPETIIKYGIELDYTRAVACEATMRVGDALWSERDWPTVDLVITNPPYSLAMEFVEKALNQTSSLVAMLLRLPFVCSQKRRDFHIAHPSKLYILPKRPSFTGGGTDATEYAWFVWSNDDRHEPGTWELL